jgi:hypothetical protein
MSLQLYKRCKGRKFKREKLKKLIKPIVCKKNSRILNYTLTEKNKIRFVTQLFRWFSKDFTYYKLNYFIKKKYIISNCDFINLSVKIQKAGWKKLLLKLNYHLKDYKNLKRRSYSLNFKFFFLNIEDNKNKEITLDIKAKNFDIFNIFITTNSYYIDDFYNIINFLNGRKFKEKDENDNMLDKLTYIFSWNRLNSIICYDVYMPWYVTKQDYYMKWKFKRKNERKYSCTIVEKKFNSIFPLKNIIGHLIVADKKVKEDNSELFYWKTLLKNDSFNKKKDFFKELKILIRRINKKYEVDSVLVYIFIQYLK